MAVTGTLEDFSIVELLQLPHAGRKTGRLSIVSPDEVVGTLFYDEGNLVHAELDNHDGMEALVRLTSWEEGEFEFITALRTETVSLEDDLHRTLMQALKIRDERQHKEVERQEAEENTLLSLPTETKRSLEEKLDLFASTNGQIRYLCITTLNNDLIAESNIPSETDEYQRLRLTISAFLASYTRSGFSRMLIEDEAGTVAIMKLDHEHALVMVASLSMPMGLVTLILGRLVDSILQTQNI